MPKLASRIFPIRRTTATHYSVRQMPHQRSSRFAVKSPRPGSQTFSRLSRSGCPSLLQVYVGVPGATTMKRTLVHGADRQLVGAADLVGDIAIAVMRSAPMQIARMTQVMFRSLIRRGG